MHLFEIMNVFFSVYNMLLSSNFFTINLVLFYESFESPL